MWYLCRSVQCPYHREWRTCVPVSHYFVPLCCCSRVESLQQWDCLLTLNIVTPSKWQELKLHFVTSLWNWVTTSPGHSWSHVLKGSNPLRNLFYCFFFLQYISLQYINCWYILHPTVNHIFDDGFSILVFMIRNDYFLIQNFSKSNLHFELFYKAIKTLHDQTEPYLWIVDPRPPISNLFARE